MKLERFKSNCRNCGSHNCFITHQFDEDYCLAHSVRNDEKSLYADGTIACDNYEPSNNLEYLEYKYEQLNTKV